MIHPEQRWMLALFLIPFLTVFIDGVAFFGVYPAMMPHFGSDFTIKILIGITTFLIPSLVALIFRKIPMTVAGIWILLTGLGFALEKGGYEGNQNVALFMFFFGFQMIATAISTILVTLKLKQRY